MDDKRRIDDPVDAARAAWTEEPENALGETALSLISAFFPPAHAFKAIKHQFSIAARCGRIEYLFQALATKVNLNSEKRFYVAGADFPSAWSWGLPVVPFYFHFLVSIFKVGLSWLTTIGDSQRGETSRLPHLP